MFTAARNFVLLPHDAAILKRRTLHAALEFSLKFMYAHTPNW